MKVELTLELINAIIGYLARQPFGDVEPLVAAVREQVGPQLQTEAPASAEGEPESI